MPTGREHRTVTREDGALRPDLTEEAKAYRRRASTILAGEVVEVKVDGSTPGDRDDNPKPGPGHGCGELGTSDLTGKKIQCDDDPDDADIADDFKVTMSIVDDPDEADATHDEHHPELDDTMDPNAPPETGEVSEPDENGEISIDPDVYTGDGVGTEKAFIDLSNLTPPYGVE